MVVPAAVVSVVVVGTVAALGGLPQVMSFLTEQDQRGLQIEAPGATPWLVTALWAPSVTRVLNEPLVTWELHGPGTQAAADVLGALFFLALGAATLLLWWRREQLGDRLWSGGIVRTELLVRGALLLTLAMIVFNKVGSPQYIAWLAAPLVVALVIDRHRWFKPAALGLAIALLTFIVYPLTYWGILIALPFPAALLTARNVLLAVLFVWVLIRLGRVQIHPHVHARSLARRSRAAAV